jgi:hypothetical protein
MIKPQNVVTTLKDKKLTLWWDLSAGLAIAGGTGVIRWSDPNAVWQVIDVTVTPTVTLSGTTTNLVVGTIDTTNRFVSSTNVVATAGNRVVGVVQRLTLNSTVLLTAGKPIVCVSTGTADTGEAIITVTVRPVEISRGGVSKRPGGSAQSTT